MTEINANEVIVTTTNIQENEVKGEIKGEFLIKGEDGTPQSYITVIPVKEGNEDDSTTTTTSSSSPPPPLSSSGNNNVVCSQCFKTFLSSKDLSVHVLKDHHNLILQRCPLCNSGVRDLTEHLLTSHQLDPPSKSSEVLPIFLPKQPVPQSQLNEKRLMITQSSSNLLEDVNLLLTVGSAPTSRPTSPVRIMESSASSSSSASFPMNLSVRRRRSSFHRNNSRSAPVSDDDSDHLVINGSNDNSSTVIIEASSSSPPLSSSNNRKRRKQTHVPDHNKDERYWARRLKNNEAAKRSRDMRIKRERVIFEENARLEKLAKDLKADLDKLTMDNKELHLKMGFIMEENSRLKSLLGMISSTSSSSSSSASSNNNNNNIITNGKTS